MLTCNKRLSDITKVPCVKSDFVDNGIWLGISKVIDPDYDLPPPQKKSKIRILYQHIQACIHAQIPTIVQQVCVIKG